MTDRQHIGTVAVDSGILMIIDPCYILGAGKPQGEDAYMAVVRPLFTEKVKSESAAETAEGTIFHPGFGDGVYDVYAEYSDEGSLGRRIKRVVIECIPDEEPDGGDGGHDVICTICGEGLCDDGNGYVHCGTDLPGCEDARHQRLRARSDIMRRVRTRRRRRTPLHRMQPLRAERISYGGLVELASLVPYMDPGDIELLEAAGVPEFPPEKLNRVGWRRYTNKGFAFISAPNGEPLPHNDGFAWQPVYAEKQENE